MGFAIHLRISFRKQLLQNGKRLAPSSLIQNPKRIQFLFARRFITFLTVSLGNTSKSNSASDRFADPRISTPFNLSANIRTYLTKRSAKQTQWSSHKSERVSLNCVRRQIGNGKTIVSRSRERVTASGYWPMICDGAEMRCDGVRYLLNATSN